MTIKKYIDNFILAYENRQKKLQSLEDYKDATEQEIFKDYMDEDDVTALYEDCVSEAIGEYIYEEFDEELVHQMKKPSKKLLECSRNRQILFLN